MSEQNGLRQLKPFCSDIALPRLASNIFDRAISCIGMALGRMSHSSLLVGEDEPKTLP